jgi:hypothetical protein
MKVKTIKTSIAMMIGALLVTMSCDDNSKLVTPQKGASASQTSTSNSGARVGNYTFDGTEGGAITLDMATRWITNYTNQNSGKITAQFFGRQTLEKMLAAKGSMGIRFYYTVDDAGNAVVSATGADVNGNDFTSNFKAHARNSSVAIKATALMASSLSTTQSDSVTTTIINRWRTNYTSANPNGVHAHFFGFEILKQILSANGCVGIRCYYAINDTGVQQLLLIAATKDGVNILPTSLTGGRTADDGTIGDLSAICPWQCSTN